MAKFLSFPFSKAQNILKGLLKTSKSSSERDFIRDIMSRARENSRKGLAGSNRLVLNERDGSWLRERASSLNTFGKDGIKNLERTPGKRGKLVNVTRDDGAPTTIRSMGQRDFDAIARDSALRQEREAARSGRKLNRTGKVTRRSLEEDTF